MRILNQFEEVLVALIFIAMVILNFANIVARYCLSASWSFTGELLLIAFIWLVFLSAAIAYKRNEHLGLPLIVNGAPRTWRMVLVGLSGLMSVTLLVFLAVSGFEMVQQQREFDQTTSVLGFPEWIAGASVPVAALIIFLRVIESTAKSVVAIRRHEDGG